jgi:hypothetical protein
MKNLFRNITATIEVPIKVALQYSHKLTNTPESTAGARERAGFIEAPDMNAKKNISRPTIPPITIPLKPFKPLVYTTTKITAIKRAEAKVSIPNIRGRGYA